MLRTGMTSSVLACMSASFAMFLAPPHAWPASGDPIRVSLIRCFAWTGDGALLGPRDRQPGLWKPAG
jgi:hypothetical protein